MKTNDKQERSLGLDYLRILLAFMVLTLHFNGSTTGAVAMNVSYLPMKLLVIIFEALSYPAVNCYILISGYFSYKQNKTVKLQFESLTKLYICILSYSLMGYVFGLLFGNSFALSELFVRFFPLSFGQWWYMSCYFALMIISPYLNRLVDAISEKEHKLLLIIMLLNLSVLPILTKLQDHIGINYGYSLIWFIMLYITGAFISKYGLYIKIRKEYYLVLYLILSVFLQAFSLFTSRIEFLQGYSVASYNSIVVYFQGICLFLYFLQCKCSNRTINRIVVKISSLSMSLYLLHCQTDIARIIWGTLKPSQICNDLRFIPIFIGVSLGLFILSCSVEWLRRQVMSMFKIESQILACVTGLTKCVLSKMT